MQTSFEYELELHDGLDDTYTKTLTVDVDFVGHCDSNYGADADGNRGVRAVSVEDVEVRISKEGGEDITGLVKAEWPIDFKKIEEKADDAAYWAADEEL